MTRTTKGKKPKTGLVRIQQVECWKLSASPENDDLYRQIDRGDGDLAALAKSIGEKGVIEPIVATADGYILSGHRRYFAASMAGLTVLPVRYVELRRSECEAGEYLRLLREFNRQRVKTTDEIIREEIVSASPEDAYSRLIQHRFRGSDIDLPTIDIQGSMKRARISSAKHPMLEAVRAVLKEHQRFLPISVRKIHYELCQNHRPLRHAEKPGSVYGNTLNAYKDLDDLLTRARIAGLIPMGAICDETRPVTTWQVYPSSAPFIREQVGGFLQGYFRDLMQSQPDHVELLIEKNTAFGVVKEVAARYTIPITAGRGYASLPPRSQMAQRYHKSGKDRLILLIASDFDPDGEAIAETFAKSMRDDFGIDDIEAVKFALTAEQAENDDLTEGLDVKLKGSRARGFLDKYGEGVRCYELEALSADRLQELATEAIDSVIDGEAFNEEVDNEARDAAELDGVRQRLQLAMRGAGYGEGEL